MILLLLIFLCLPIASVAQVPQQTGMQIFLAENSIPVQGTQQVTVSWYTVPVGGIPENSEVISTQFTDGYASIVLGTLNPISDTVLMRGSLWLGLQLNGGQEFNPRTMILSSPFARIAQRAIEAQSLSSEVTGVVTSVNEIAGNVLVVPGKLIDITRNGPILTISTISVYESGELFGNNIAHEFQIVPSTPITLQTPVQVQVSSKHTNIGCTVVSIDPSTNIITVQTAAPLSADESLRWIVFKQ